MLLRELHLRLENEITAGYIADNPAEVISKYPLHAMAYIGRAVEKNSDGWLIYTNKINDLGEYNQLFASDEDKEKLDEIIDDFIEYMRRQLELRLRVEGRA